MAQDWLANEPPAIQECVKAVIKRMGGVCPEATCKYCPGLMDALESLIASVRLDVLGRDASQRMDREGSAC